VLISIKKVYTIYMRWYNQFRSSKKTILNGLWGAVYFIFFIVLLYNIVLSQTISPLYSKFVQDEKNSVGFVLKSILSTPEFNGLYISYKNKYGQKIENEVFAEKRNDTLYINNLEELLKKNPNARDVNYNLSKTLNKTGHEGGRYLIQAKQIDPELK